MTWMVWVLKPPKRLLGIERVCGLTCLKGMYVLSFEGLVFDVSRVLFESPIFGMESWSLGNGGEWRKSWEIQWLGDLQMWLLMVASRRSQKTSCGLTGTPPQTTEVLYHRVVSIKESRLSFHLPRWGCWVGSKLWFRSQLCRRWSWIEVVTRWTLRLCDFLRGLVALGFSYAMSSGAWAHEEASLWWSCLLWLEPGASSQPLEMDGLLCRISKCSKSFHRNPRGSTTLSWRFSICRREFPLAVSILCSISHSFVWKPKRS